MGRSMKQKEKLYSDNVETLKSQLLSNLSKQKVDWDSVIEIANRAKSLSDYSSWTKEQIKDIRDNL